jgi:hypothetical protein
LFVPLATYVPPEPPPPPPKHAPPSPAVAPADGERTAPTPPAPATPLIPPIYVFVDNVLTSHNSRFVFKLNNISRISDFRIRTLKIQ